MKLSKLSKAELYGACQNEGFVLPKLTSTVCRVQYLVSVRSGNEYCPQKDEVQHKHGTCSRYPALNCENPPKKVIMLQIIFEELERRGDNRTLSFDEKHMPDVDWCLYALSALIP